MSQFLAKCPPCTADESRLVPSTTLNATPQSRPDEPFPFTKSSPIIVENTERSCAKFPVEAPWEGSGHGVRPRCRVRACSRWSRVDCTAHAHTSRAFVPKPATKGGCSIMTRTWRIHRIAAVIRRDMAHSATWLKTLTWQLSCRQRGQLCEA
jgi:hypothetical protein